MSDGEDDVDEFEGDLDDDVVAIDRPDSETVAPLEPGDRGYFGARRIPWREEWGNISRSFTQKVDRDEDRGPALRAPAAKRRGPLKVSFGDDDVWERPVGRKFVRKYDEDREMIHRGRAVPGKVRPVPKFESKRKVVPRRRFETASIKGPVFTTRGRYDSHEDYLAGRLSSVPVSRKRSQSLSGLLDYERYAQERIGEEYATIIERAAAAGPAAPGEDYQVENRRIVDDFFDRAEALMVHDDVQEAPVVAPEVAGVLDDVPGLPVRPHPVAEMIEKKFQEVRDRRALREFGVEVAKRVPGNYDLARECYRVADAAGGAAGALLAKLDPTGEGVSDVSVQAIISSVEKDGLTRGSSSFWWIPSNTITDIINGVTTGDPLGFQSFSVYSPTVQGYLNNFPMAGGQYVDGTVGPNVDTLFMPQPVNGIPLNVLGFPLDWKGGGRQGRFAEMTALEIRGCFQFNINTADLNRSDEVRIMVVNVKKPRWISNYITDVNGPHGSYDPQFVYEMFASSFAPLSGDYNFNASIGSMAFFLNPNRCKDYEVLYDHVHRYSSPPILIGNSFTYNPVPTLLGPSVNKLAQVNQIANDSVTTVQYNPVPSAGILPQPLAGVTQNSHANVATFDYIVGSKVSPFQTVDWNPNSLGSAYNLGHTEVKTYSQVTDVTGTVGVGGDFLGGVPIGTFALGTGVIGPLIPGMAAIFGTNTYGLTQTGSALTQLTDFDLGPSIGAAAPVNGLMNLNLEANTVNTMFTQNNQAVTGLETLTLPTLADGGVKFPIMATDNATITRLDDLMLPSVTDGGAPFPIMQTVMPAYGVMQDVFPFDLVLPLQGIRTWYDDSLNGAGPPVIVQNAIFVLAWTKNGFLNWSPADSSVISGPNSYSTGSKVCLYYVDG